MAAERRSTAPPMTDAMPVGIDALIHERVRLGIMSALSATPSLPFRELRDVLQLTDGNLSVHARKLEDAGYLLCEKSFDGRVPRTTFSITAAGRAAFLGYLDQMESVIRRARTGEP